MLGGLAESRPGAPVQRVFEALSSATRRKILAYLSHAELTAGEIAARFEISKPAVSQHLSVLENAGLVTSDKRGQYVFYRLAPDNLVCPVAKPIRRESESLTMTQD
jgi:ArsR family transcriptional regulator